MPDRIGNYIHFKYDNYIRYGIGTKQRPKQENIQSVFNQQKAYIKQEALRLSHGEKFGPIKTEIENRLNGLRDRGKLLDLGWTEAEINDIQKRIEQLISEKIDLKGSRIIWDTLDVVSIDNDFNNSVAGLSLLGEKSSINFISSVENRIEMLKSISASVTKELKMSNGFTGEKFLENMKLISDSEDKIIKEVGSLWRNAQGQFTKVGAGIEEKRAIYNEDFIKAINENMKAARTQIQSYLKGVVGEMYAAVMAEFTAAKSKEEGLKLLEQMEKDFEKSFEKNKMVGKETGAAVLLSSQFAITGGDKEKDNRHFINDGKAFTHFGYGDASLNWTQNKVDLIMSLDSIDKPVDISIKNYNLNHDITVHSGVNILSLTQDYPNFLNHYLNIASTRYGPYNERKYSPDQGTIYKLNALLRQTMALKGLSGGIWKLGKGGQISKGNEATLLVVNDNSGRYVVYAISDLIWKILNNVELIKIDSIPDTKTWKNIWKTGELNYSNAYSRINMLLASLRSYHYKIQINKSLFV